MIAALDRAYDPAWAAPWDAVGLVCGDPDADVSRILLAVDPVEATVDEALQIGADLLITHHPLFLTRRARRSGQRPEGAARAPPDRWRMRAVRRPHERRRRRPGVSDALARASACTTSVRSRRSERALGQDRRVRADGRRRRVDRRHGGRRCGRVRRVRPVRVDHHRRGHVPSRAAREPVGRRGRQSSSGCPRPGSRWSCRHRFGAAVVAALRAAHPYEEPAFDVLHLEPAIAPTPRHRSHRPTGRADAAGRLDRPRGRGSARDGRRRPSHRRARLDGVHRRGLRWFRRRVRRAGPSRRRRRVPHRATFATTSPSEAAERSAGAPSLHPPMALIDVAHWASEWPWLDGRGRPAPRRPRRRRHYGGRPRVRPRHRSLDAARTDR